MNREGVKCGGGRREVCLRHVKYALRACGVLRIEVPAAREGQGIKGKGVKVKA